MSGNKKNKVSYALEKEARMSGQDEYESIVRLKREADIKITRKEISKLKGLYMYIKVIRPFDENFFNIIKKRFKSYFPLIDCSNYVKKIEKKDKSYIKYPEEVLVSEVDNEINVDLSEKHDICDDYLSEEEWEEIQESKRWKETQKQIASEIIADRLLDEINRQKFGIDKTQR
ncbi:MAG: hypothetical protein EU529_11495 [Promethearchaeota archaeon]|nr:MAG: hypothetical protein EU529_11495 [Candidatus Lokiarchaeota archaeon]